MIGHANGPGEFSTFSSPKFLTFDSERNIIIVSDSSNNLIRTIYNPTPSSQPTQQPTSRPSNQPISHPSMQPSCQPTSQPTSQPINRPTSQPVRRPSSQPTSQPVHRPSSQPTDRPTGYRGLDVYTLAGGGSGGTNSGYLDGTGTNALFYYPAGGSVNTATGDLYISDEVNNRIRKITSLGRNPKL